MTNGAKQIHGQVCARAGELAQTDRLPSSSHAVSGALLEARINVDGLTLDEWKAILFGAFRAANEASSLRPASSETAKESRSLAWHLSVNN
jgi:hypothetical protein